jgi:hypothetical protein
MGGVPRLEDLCTRSWLHLCHKALAGRPADIGDLATLRGELRLRSAADALAIVKRYVPERLLTARVQYLVEDLFDDEDR